jgi:hypothetical protein
MLRNPSGKHFVRCLLSNKHDAFKWDLVIIYGAAQSAGREDFLREFSQVCQQRKFSTVYGGDFNLIRHAGEKNTPGGMSKWNTIFNIIIENNNLMDINLSNRKYTWCNDHVIPTYTKLDRFLVSVSWMDKYPLSNVMAMPREMSDHTPLILDIGESKERSVGQCKFELSWLTKEDIMEVVRPIWDVDANGKCAIEELNWRLGNTRKKLRGWAKNVDAAYKKEKKRLSDILHYLDSQAEICGLSNVDREVMLETKKLYNDLVREDNIIFFQRAKSVDLKLGQTCTRYLMNKASGRKRKNKIIQLMEGENIIKGDENLLAHATEFYKSLFGQSERSSVGINFDFLDRVSEDENEDLKKPFSFEEIKGILFSLAHNKSPGPDGFPREFYQFFWDLIKVPLKKVFDEFVNGKLDIGRLNFGTITLLPKCEDAMMIQKFRPICLMNTSLKIMTKGMNNRVLSPVAEHIIDKTQTAFMKSRHIMEGVCVLHEVLHEVKKKKMSGVLFKVDFEKAYDNVNWAFLYNVLLKKGFSYKWNVCSVS